MGELSVASRLAGGGVPKKGRGHQHRRTAEMIQQLYTPNLSELPEDLEGKEPSGSVEESSEEESSDFSQDDEGQSPMKGKNDSSSSYETTNEDEISDSELERRNQDPYRSVGITGRTRKMVHSGGELKMYFEEADPDKVLAKITPEGVLVWKQKNFVDCLGQNVDIRNVDQVIEGKGSKAFKAEKNRNILEDRCFTVYYYDDEDMEDSKIEPLNFVAPNGHFRDVWVDALRKFHDWCRTEEEERKDSLDLSE